MFVEKKCDYCGKVFYPTIYHAYKGTVRTCKMRWFCSYTCMLRYREKYGPKEKKGVK